MKFLSIKAIPAVFWSSDRSLNFKPRLLTLAILCLGLVVFGVGEALLVAAGAGVSPWVVFAQGIGNITGWSIGWANFAVSVAVLLLWIPLKQTPGLGTLLNAIIISAAIEFFLAYLPIPEFYAVKIAQCLLGILLVGIGSGLYLIANLGPGPRDGLMTGMQRVTNFPIAWVRTSIEIGVVFLGWWLGGTVGLGTFLYAFGIGPSVALGLYVVHRLSSKKN